MKRLIDNIMSWNRLRTETIKVPMIQLDPSHINVIKTPMEFYQALKVRIPLGHYQHTILIFISPNYVV